MPYFDVYRELIENQNFLKEITQMTAEVSALEREIEQYPQFASKLANKSWELLKQCDYNAGLLVPYFFPQYPKESPLSLMDRPYSFAIFNFQIGGYTVIRASRQIGKCLGHSTLHNVLLKNTDKKQMTARSIFELALSQQQR